MECHFFLDNSHSISHSFLFMFTPPQKSEPDSISCRESRPIELKWFRSHTYTCSITPTLSLPYPPPQKPAFFSSPPLSSCPFFLFFHPHQVSILFFQRTQVFELKSFFLLLPYFPFYFFISTKLDQFHLFRTEQLGLLLHLTNPNISIQNQRNVERRSVLVRL